FISQDKYVAEILRKFGFTDGILASTPIDTEKPLVNDPDGQDVDVHIYSFQVTLKVLHLHAAKRIFSDYAGASLDRKSTTEGCQFLGCRLISWQCKKQTVVAASSTEAEYVAAASCCAQQFWNSVSIKKSNDVVRLQALIDRKKVIITEDIIRQSLCLDDAAGVDCLPNKEIFVELARMGYEKSYTKLTFYKAFFSAQMEVPHSHNSSVMVRNVDSPLKFLMIGKGFSGVDTPLFDGMLVQQQVQDVKDVAEDGDDDNEVSAEPTSPSPTSTTPPPSHTQEHIPSPPQAQTAQASSPPPQQPRLEKKRQFKSLRLKRLRKVKTTQRVESSADTVMDDQEDASKQGEIVELDADEDVTLVDAEEDINDTDEAEPVEVEEVIKVVATAKLMTEVVTIAATTITAAQVPKVSAPRRRRGVVIQDPKEIATASVIMHTEVKSKDKGKGILIEEPKPLKRQAQIEQDKAFARQLEAELNANINWDDVMEQVKRKEK
nr:hypothetical protein [Tanacetum cinerariifolium]